MRGVRVVLIGGTSNVGKSTVAQVVAERLGFAYRSTDQLARHPGRPWRTAERAVPQHVAEHYASLPVDDLITSVLDHYARLWPRIEELVTAHADGAEGTETGLVLEGSALWPGRVAGLTVPRVAAVWLTAEPSVVRARVRTAGRYAAATAAERHLMDKFLARTERYQTLMLSVVHRLGLDHLDAGDGRTPQELADAVLAAAAAQRAVGRRPSGTAPDGHGSPLTS
ncbi:AAA family ATPase [Streptomyces noursei]|uniref:AAA family ATPase n=1 Tax=Streptomyces noursei TaxID=1971 RepID=UPI00381166CF